MVYGILALLGLAFGSFTTALTWRLHEGKDFVAGRSECESCGHILGPLDLVPVISWLLLAGRCRYCHKKISWQNPLLEVVMVLLFTGSYLCWPAQLVSWQAWLSFGLWLFYLVLLVSLVVYDLRWMLLPNRFVYVLIAAGLLDAGLRLYVSGGLSLVAYAGQVVWGAAAFGGFYGLLYVVSQGKWVGLGDVKLGLFVGIVLGWQQALLALFLANGIGLLVVAPALLGHKLSMRSRLPFGPFIAAAFIIAGLFGGQIINWYLSLILLR